MHRRRLLQTALAGVPWLVQSQLPAASSPPAPAPAPAPLGPGSQVLALAPGTWLERDDRLLQRLRDRCQQQRWQLRLPDELFRRWQWFSGSDRQRRDLLQQAWQDASIDALFYVGAAWGSARVLEAGFQPGSAPRWCVGFSDCSALLLAQLAAGSMGAIHGWFGGDQVQWMRLVNLLQAKPVTALQGDPQQSGVAEGPLVVSNLSIATSLIGTPWLPSLQGAILVLEDTGEAPYRLDRQLTQWRSSGLLKGVAGIGLGRFDWTPDHVLPGDFTVDQILMERLKPLGVPIVRQLPVGHGVPNLALPLGRRARLDGDRGTLTLLP